ncbi:MAG: gp436 family protein [Candidatus Binatus sp.]|jgi:phage gp36-like protein
MSYAQIADMEARFPNRDLVQLTNEDPTVTTVGTASLQTALDDAGAEIDAYLAGRFELPLTDPPPVLLLWCCRIAFYNLFVLSPSLEAPAEVVARYTTIIKQLEQVRDGKLTLGIATDTGEEPPPAAETVLTEGPRVEGGARLMEWRRLKGF